jgi:hypothetical protein
MEAQKQDQHNRQLISKEHGKLKKEMQSLRIRKSSLKAYKKTVVQSDGYFVDNKK